MVLHSRVEVVSILIYFPSNNVFFISLLFSFDKEDNSEDEEDGKYKWLSQCGRKNIWCCCIGIFPCWFSVTKRDSISYMTIMIMIKFAVCIVGCFVSKEFDAIFKLCILWTGEEEEDGVDALEGDPEQDDEDIDGEEEEEIDEEEVEEEEDEDEDEEDVPLDALYKEYNPVSDWLWIPFPSCFTVSF